MATPRRDAKKDRSRQARAARAAAKRRQRTAKIFSIMIVMALVLSGVAFGVNSLTSSQSNSSSTTTSTLVPLAQKARSVTGVTPCPAADGSTSPASSFAQAPPMCIDPAKKYTATFDTTEGTIVVALDTTKTPNTVNNFVVLSRYHYYDGTKIFRTDPSIDIIQGGSPHSDDNTDPGPGYTIKDEGTGFTYSAGDLVMARSQGADSASAQYFFGTGPNVAQLNSQGTYVTFGHTTSGLDVLQKIIGLNSGSGSLGGAPSRTVWVKSLTITES